MLKRAKPYLINNFKFILSLVSLIGGLLLSTAAYTQQSNTAEALASVLSKLQGGGYVIYLRHTATDLNTKDIDLDFSRCETQRVLSAEGREQAKQIGLAFRKLAIPIAKVISSPFCRCKDTAQLAFQRYEVNKDLHFALDVAPLERARLAKALSKMLSTPPERGSNTVIIAHTANLKEATGIWPKSEGSAYIFEPQADGGFKQVVLHVQAKDWTDLAEKKPSGHER